MLLLSRNFVYIYLRHNRRSLVTARLVSETHRRRIYSMANGKRPLLAEDLNPERSQLLSGQQHYQCFLQVLASDVDHNGASLMVVFDKGGRFMFNTGEGLQRMMRESRVKMNKMEHYFFTRVSTETLSGLPGMLLSTSSSSDAGGLLKGQEICTIIGPEGISNYVHAFKNYINNTQSIKVEELPSAFENSGSFIIVKPVVHTPFCTVTPVVVSQANAAEQCHSKASDYKGDSQEEYGGALQNSNNIQKEKWSNRFISPLDAVCYICQLEGVPGKVDAAKMSALDIPMGKERGELQRGLAVTLLTGRVVEPHEVMTPGSPGPLLLIVDCPTEAHLATISAKGNGPLCQWTNSTSSDVHCVMAHMGPYDLVTSPAYQAWIQSLGSIWTHMYISSGNAQPTTLRRATELQVKLNCLHSGLFPMLHTPSCTNYPEHGQPSSSDKTVGNLTACSGDIFLPPIGYKYNLLPQRIRGGDEREVVKAIDLEEVRNTFNASALAVIESAHAACSTSSTLSGLDASPPCLSNIGREELEVVFLGTVSSVPSKFRNVTAIYLDRFSHGGMLLDCGEDTLGQMKRRYGVKDCERRLQELACIWVSHMHADHHGGLYRLLELRTELIIANNSTEPPSPLLIIGPDQLFHVLSEYRQVLHAPFHFLPNSHLLPGYDGRQVPHYVHQMFDQAMKRLALKSIQPFPVEHVGSACGICIEGETGWKIVFSGDTRPCQSLVKAAHKCTLLIHEATFEDGMKSEAIAKRHSTTAEAMSVAAEAQAYRTILTHFSTRYPTMPELSSRPDVGIAMDFMSVNLLDLPWLPKMVEPLTALFKQQESVWEAEDDGACGDVVAVEKVVKRGKKGRI